MGDVSQDTFAFLSLISRSLHVWRISFYFLIIKKDKNSPTALPWEHAENKTPEPHVHPGVGVDVGENVLTQLIKKQTEPKPHIVQKSPGLVVGRLATPQALSDSQGQPPHLLDMLPPSVSVRFPLQLGLWDRGETELADPVL